MTTVSIVIPTYNRAHMLPYSLSSVEKQNIADVEVIVVDDGSSDNTAEVIMEWQERLPGLKYITNSRKKGPSGARNTGIMNSTGQFIAFLDSDDEWMPDHLKTALSYLTDSNTDIDIFTANPLRKNRITGDIFREDELDLTNYHYQRMSNGYLFDPETIFKTALSHRIITTQTLVAKSSLIKSVLFDEDLIWGEDNMYMLDLAHQKPKILHVQKYHVTYWGHDGNLTNCIGLKSESERSKATLGMANFYHKALEKYSDGISINPTFKREAASFLFWQAGYSALATQGNYKDAITYYKLGLKLQPFNVKMLKTLFIHHVKHLYRRFNS